jgi:hypothetical protein
VGTVSGYVHLACWLLVAGVLLVSTVSKLRNRSSFNAFADSVAETGIVAPTLVRPVAAAVVVTEAAAVALLVVPRLATAGLVLAFVLLLVFTSVVVMALSRGIQASCGCFGASAQPYNAGHLVRNLLLLAAVAFALGSSPPQAIEPSSVAVSVFAAFSGGLVIVFLVDFVSLFRTARPSVGRTPVSARRTPL